MGKNAVVKIFVNRQLQDLNPLFVGSEHCEAGHSFGPYRQSYTLIHYVSKGTGIVKKGENIYRVNPGEAFLINSNEMVTYTADIHDPWVYCWVAFDGKMTEKLKSLPTVIPFPSGILQQMLDEADKDMPEYRVAALLYTMYVKLFEGKATNNHYVRRVKDYIKALYMTPISVEAIAREMKLDRRYLTRIFKEKTGNTIMDYILSVRMEEAKKCLTEGFSVEETAMLCGYEDTCNFSKMFKRRFGVSPLHWKKANVIGN